MTNTNKCYSLENARYGIYQNGSLVQELTTDSDGYAKSTILQEGDYQVKEIEASKGYTVDNNTYTVTVTKDSTVPATSNENPKNDPIGIEIVKNDVEDLGLPQGDATLEGAEFTFKLKSEVDHVGWDSATTYDVVTTDENGWALTKELPYGTYLVRETVTPKDYYTNPDFTVSITQDTSEIKKEEDKIKKIILNNRPVETQLKLVKKDKTSGKTVTLNSASFKIVADEDIKDGGNVVYKQGEYITQKVGGKKYDTFTTNADNVVVAKNEYTSDDDTKGEVILPLQLFAGKYHLEEVKVPKGFLKLGQAQTFE